MEQKKTSNNMTSNKIGTFHDM